MDVLLFSKSKLFSKLQVGVSSLCAGVVYVSSKDSKPVLITGLASMLWLLHTEIWQGLLQEGPGH